MVCCSGEAWTGVCNASISPQTPFAGTPGAVVIDVLTPSTGAPGKFGGCVDMLREGIFDIGAGAGIGGTGGGVGFVTG